MQGPSFRFVRSTLADRFEPVVRELANVKLEITLDESGASYFHDPRRFGPTNLGPRTPRGAHERASLAAIRDR